MTFLSNIIIPSGIYADTPVQVFSGNGSTSQYTLSSAPGSLQSLEVFIQGVRQTPTTNYQVNNTTLEFVQPPPTGTNNIFVRWISTMPINVPLDGSISASKLDTGLTNTLAGKITGPASTTDNTVARYDGGTGKLLQSSQATLNDVGGFAGVTSINGGPLAGLRNKVINGNFDIWQRGTNFSGVGAAISADRFYAGSYGSTGTVNRATVLPGSAAQLNTGANYRLDITGTAGNAYHMVSQRIEDVQSFAGKTITISIYCDTAKGASAPYFRLVQAFGSGGSTSVLTDFNITEVAGENGDFRWVATVNIPSISGKTIGSGSYLEMALIWVPITPTTKYGFYGMQAEVGSVATPFEHRPYGLELALCQRYYEAGSIGSAGGYTTAVAASVYKVKDICFAVEKRSTPTIVLSSLTYTQSASATVADTNTKGFSVSVTSSFANSNIRLDTGNYTASAEL